MISLVCRVAVQKGDSKKIRNPPESLKNTLREMIKIVGPSFAVVTLIVHVPNVRNIMLIQIYVKALGTADQAVLIAAGKVKEFHCRPMATKAATFQCGFS